MIEGSGRGAVPELRPSLVLGDGHCRLQLPPLAVGDTGKKSVQWLLGSTCGDRQTAQVSGAAFEIRERGHIRWTMV